MHQVYTGLGDSTANFKEKIGANIPKIKFLFNIKDIEQFGKILKYLHLLLWIQVYKWAQKLKQSLWLCIPEVKQCLWKSSSKKSSVESTPSILTCVGIQNNYAPQFYMIILSESVSCLCST